MFLTNVGDLRARETESYLAAYRQSCRPCYCHPMTKGELAIQLIKIALRAAIGTYFVWWSLEVLHRLPPH